MTNPADLGLDPVDTEYLTPGLERWRKATDGPLLILAIGSLPLLLLELKRSELPYIDRIFLDVVNLTVLFAFATDYLIELKLATKRRSFVRSEWTSLAIVLSQLLALIPGLGGVGALRALRGARAFRLFAVILRLLSIGGAAASEGRSLLRRRAARFALSMAALTCLTSAAAFTLVEDVGEGGRLHSFGDAMWWSIATITTVGYGDVYPVTPVGRLLGAFTMVVGISTFAVVTAKVAEFLVRADIEGREPGARTSSARQILEERLASGEIQIREYEELNRVLGEQIRSD